MDLRILDVDEVNRLRKRLEVADVEYRILFDAYGVAERELALLKRIVKASYYAPQEGTTVPVFKVADREMDKEIVEWLLKNGVERYVPKEKRK